MSNIYDYLNWRGDLTFDVDPFNEIDALILSELVYVAFDQIVRDKPISLIEASKSFFIKHDEQTLLDRFSFIKESITLLKVLPQYPRFANIKLANYVNDLNYEDDKQFAALTIYLNEDTIFVAYRGTDDTILGWKEDFKMTYQYPIEAQLQAVAYLNQLLLNSKPSLISGIKQRFKKKEFILAGHSKGGNLAVMAASLVDKSFHKQIKAIYNFDGPGFFQTMIDETNYRLIVDKIHKYIPENSVFGIMLQSLEKSVIVKSKARGIMQHSGFTWQISGKNFQTVSCLSKSSLALNDAFNAWLEKVDLNTRENAVKAIFSILEAMEIKTIDDFAEKSLPNLYMGLKEFSNMENENKNAIINFIKTLIVESSNYHMYYLSNKDNSSKINN